MKINLIIGGAEKGGTTTLFHLLKNHPSIVLPRAKELHFFSDDSRFHVPEEIDYSAYHKSFFSRSYSYKMKMYYKVLMGATVFGDATPDYMWWKTAPYRVFQYNSDAKWVLLLRNPIDRAFSHWKMEFYKKNRENLSFIDALMQEEERASQMSPMQDKIFSYKSRGFYTEQLRNIYRYFDKKNIYINTSDELRNNTLSVVSDICVFLGVSKYNESYIPKSYDQNKSSNNVKLSKDCRLYLVNVFRDEINELEKLLNKDLSEWLL